MPAGRGNIDFPSVFSALSSVGYDGYVNVDYGGVPPDQIWIFTGRVHGTISKEARGEGGFGFDPIFVPSGHSRTFAQMTLEEKGGLSHRALAFRRLGSWVTR